MLSLIKDHKLTPFSFSRGSGNFFLRFTKGKLNPTDFMDASVPFSYLNEYESSSSESKEDLWNSDSLLLNELDDRKSRVSKKLLSSSSVSSSAASCLSLSSSESVGLSSGRTKNCQNAKAIQMPTTESTIILNPWK